MFDILSNEVNANDENKTQHKENQNKKYFGARDSVDLSRMRKEMSQKTDEIKVLKNRINKLENSFIVNENLSYCACGTQCTCPEEGSVLLSCNTSNVVDCQCKYLDNDKMFLQNRTHELECKLDCTTQRLNELACITGCSMKTSRSSDSISQPNQSLLLENEALKNKLQQLVLKLQLSKQTTESCNKNATELKINQKDYSIENLLKRKASAEKQLNNLQNDIKRMNSDIIQKLKTESDQSKKESENYKKLQKTCVRELDKLKQEHANKVNALEALLDKVQSTRDKYDELARKCETQRQLNENLRSRNISLTQECCCLKNQLIQQKDLNAATQKCFNDFKNAADNLRNCTRQEVFGLSCDVKKLQNDEDCGACVDTSRPLNCFESNLPCSEIRRPNTKHQKYK